MKKRKLDAVRRWVSRSVLGVLVVVLMMIGLLIGMTSPVEAANNRVAVVTKVVGEVQIQKSGGSKTFRAYEELILNHGDTIKTGANASLSIRLQDRDDEVIIAQNSELSISELADAVDGAKQSKFSLWAGSLWSSVTSLFGSDDKFEVETPTAVMGVRGTHLFVSHDPLSGMSLMSIISGHGEVTGHHNQGSFDLYPLTQIMVGDTQATGTSTTHPFNLQSFVLELNPTVLSEILQNSERILVENQAYLAQFSDELTGSQKAIEANTAAVLKAILTNVRQNGAPDERAIAEQFMRNLSEQQRQEIEQALAYQVSSAELAEQQKAREQLKIAQALQRNSTEEAQDKSKEVLNRLLEERKKREEQNKQAELQSKKEAEQAHAAKLTDEQLAQYLLNKKKIEEQRKRQNEQSAPQQPTPIYVPAVPDEDHSGEEPGGGEGEEPGGGEGEEPGGGEGEEPGGGEGEEPGEGEDPAIITFISEMVHVIVQHADYVLPSEVEAIMSDGSMSMVAVQWNDTAVDTAVPGKYTYTGQVADYSGVVQLTLYVSEYGIAEIEGSLDASALTTEVDVIYVEAYKWDINEGLASEPSVSLPIAWQEGQSNYPFQLQVPMMDDPEYSYRVAYRLPTFPEQSLLYEKGYWKSGKMTSMHEYADTLVLQAGAYSESITLSLLSKRQISGSIVLPIKSAGVDYEDAATEEEVVVTVNLMLPLEENPVQTTSYTVPVGARSVPFVLEVDPEEEYIINYFVYEHDIWGFEYSYDSQYTEEPENKVPLHTALADINGVTLNFIRQMPVPELNSGDTFVQVKWLDPEYESVSGTYYAIYVNNQLWGSELVPDDPDDLQGYEYMIDSLEPATEYRIRLERYNTERYPVAVEQAITVKTQVGL